MKKASLATVHFLNKCIQKGIGITLLWLALLLLLQSPLQAQERRISGKVVNDKGEPVSGASVIVKGTKQGTATDTTGAFSISVPSSPTLIISITGYTTQQIVVGSRQILTIQLTPFNKELDQVVVVGYGTQRKRDVTGSIVSVSARTLAEVPAANIGVGLQGRAAGLEIQKVGTQPGASPVIRIRGERSILGSNDPLLILDGIPYEGGNLNDINPQDIASLEILKDASATAIYGSRGANEIGRAHV